jgi:hypothetical protein
MTGYKHPAGRLPSPGQRTSRPGEGPAYFGSRPVEATGFGSARATNEAPGLQAKYASEAAEGGGVGREVAQGIQRAQGRGQPLATDVRAPMEQAFGASFGGVRVHADSQADTLARSLNARAFTTGQDIFFREGAYNPASTAGRQVLAHELTHVIQQGGAMGARGAPAPQALSLGPPDDAYEREADRVARDVNQAIESGGPAPGLGPMPRPSIQPGGDAQGRVQRIVVNYVMAGVKKPGSASTVLMNNNLGGGTAANKYIRPPGFIDGAAPYGHHRGHLIANCLGGDGNDVENLVTLTPGTNSHKMNPVEVALRNYVKGLPDAKNHKVEYTVTANYTGSFHGGSTKGVDFPATKWIAPPAPRSVTLEAEYFMKAKGKGKGKGKGKAQWQTQGPVTAGGYTFPIKIKNGQ